MDERRHEAAVSASATGPAVEIDDVLSINRLSALQVGILTICFTASIVNGADRQGVGLVTSSLMKALGISTTQMGFVFALDNFGAVIGAILCGRMSDRYGRKNVLVVALALMTVSTLFTAQSGSLYSLSAARFVAGLGLGGAVPAFLALSSEYVGRPRRGSIAAMIFAGYPLGGALGGLWTGYLLKHHTWPSVFYVGGILPAIVFVAAILFLPESLQFLTRKGKQVQAVRIARRISPTLPTGPLRLIDPQDSRNESAGSVRALFSDGLAIPTISLWGVYLFLFATTKVAVVWVPTIVSREGLTPASIALIFGGFNVAALAGQLIPFKVENLSRVLAYMVAGLLLITASLTTVGLFPYTLSVVAVAIAATGYGVGIATSRCVALAATIYPTAHRGVGMGAAMAASRFGQVLSPLAIAWLMNEAIGTRFTLYFIAAMPIVAVAFVLLFGASRAGPRAQAF